LPVTVSLLASEKQIEVGEINCFAMSISVRSWRLFAEGRDFNHNTGGTMKYLCMIFNDESNFGTMSKEQMDAMMAEYGAFTEGIKKSGQYIGGNPLQPSHTATTVRVRQGKISTTDGPFAETKEKLGGYYLIDAKDLNEAIQVASHIPGARTGSIEVRPIMVY
jgi:hypothetical protein